MYLTCTSEPETPESLDEALVEAKTQATTIISQGLCVTTIKKLFNGFQGVGLTMSSQEHV